MSSEPSLDIIIGQSTITRNNFSYNYETQSCAFPSGGFLSIISLKGSERNNIIVSNRSISAISFSRTGNSIAVGESGPSSSVYVLTFTGDKYDNVESKIVINTKEKGFSCLSLDYANKRLITVGKGDQPFLLLWDLKKSNPVILGHYHLPVTPTHISMNDNIALVSGNKMLKIIHLAVTYKGSPVLLKVTNANILSYKNSKFVAVDCQANTCYALTSNGTLCSFNSRNISKQLSLKTFNTNRGTTTSMSVDEKLIVCGTTKGSILGIKRTIPLHLFGRFLSPDKSVVAVGVLKNSLVAAYSDGCIMFWKRKLNTVPRLSFSSSIGPICAMHLIHEETVLISVGNDGFIRAWEIKSENENSSQALIGEVLLKKYEKDLNDISGIRCITSASNDRFLFAGDDNGSLFKINSSNLQKMNEIKENGKSVHCIATHPSLPLIATGGGDGDLRVYNISSDNIVLSMDKKLSDSPITHITFTETGIICTSSTKMFFCHLPNLKCAVYAEYNGTSLFMSLSYAKQAQLVFASCEDMNLHAFDTNTGKIFRTYRLSYSDFPIKAIIHHSGLVIAAAMSDGQVLIIDTMSGEIILSFQTYAVNITDILFHENDIIVSTFSGCMLRWKLPQIIHNILDGEQKEENNEEMPGSNALARSSIFKSILGSNNPQPQWVFNEISDVSSPQLEEEVQGEAFDDESNLNQQGFDDYGKPNDQNVIENDNSDDVEEIKDIFRRSFYGKKDIKSINEGKKLLNKTPLLNDNDDDDNNENEDENPNLSIPNKKSDEINQLSKQISDLMNKASSYLTMELTDQREIDAQKQLKEVVNILNPFDESFESNYKRLTDYSNQLLNYAKELQNLAQKTKDCSLDITKTIDSL